MATPVDRLPPGFVVESQPGLPPGFVVESQPQLESAPAPPFSMAEPVPQQPSRPLTRAERAAAMGATSLLDQAGSVIRDSAQDASQFLGDAARQLPAPLQTAAQIGSSIVAEPIAGLAGIGAATDGQSPPGRGAQAVQDTRQALTFQPTPGATQTTAELVAPVVESMANAVPQPVREAASTAAGAVSEAFTATEEGALAHLGPGAATFVSTLPTAALEAIPALSAFKKLRGAPVDTADEVIEEAAAARQAPDPDSIRDGNTPPEAEDIENVAAHLARPDRVAEDVRPDREILSAAERLGVDLNPSHYSTNQAFIEVEQSLKSRTGNRLAAREQQAILDTGRGADRLIKDLGGSLDKSLLDAKVRDDINAKRKNLDDGAEKAFGHVRSVIPASTKVEPESARAYVQRLLADLGGGKEAEALLSPSERQLLKIVGEGATPTYRSLDRLRMAVGSALNRKSGPFKDEEVGPLKQLYKVLSEDQQGVADAFGVGGAYAAGRKLVSTRKALEKRAIELFGRDVGGSLLPKMRQAATALTQADVSRLNRLMNAIPPALRQEAAATMLNDLFTLGSRRGGDLGQGFVSAFAALQRNPGAMMALFRHLPKDARKRFLDVGRVATGIFRAKGRENVSRTARDVIAALEDGGLVGKVLGETGKVAVSEGFGSLATGVVGVGTVSRVINAASTKKTPRTQAADELLASSAFREAVKSAADGRNARAENIAQRGQPFRKWLGLQSPGVKAEIAAIGLIPWLLRDEGEDTAPAR